MAWRIRLAALAGAGGFLAVALGIRALTGVAMVDSTGALAQYSGTALYAAMIYAGVFLVRPGARPWVAGAAAVMFCWLVEFFQLTGRPAVWSDHSLIARLVLGRQFDPADLAWYAIGVLPLVLIHTAATRLRRRDRARAARAGAMDSGQGDTDDGQYTPRTSCGS